MDISVKICEHFGYTPLDIAKKARGGIREYSYKEIVSRVIYGKNSLSEEFPEFSKDTTAALLGKLFPGKTKISQSWRAYLISSINNKRCSKCTTIKDIKEFSKNAKEPDGLRAQCRTCSSDSYKKHYQDNHQEMLSRTRDYYKNNKDARQEYNKAYYQANIEYFDARNAIRRARELNAAVSWANIDEIDKIYLNKPYGYHVDHIVPLQGKLVCGLHVEHNLQYLTKSANLTKSNNFDSETHEHSTTYTPPYRTN